jgi:hypothetical protein
MESKTAKLKRLVKLERECKKLEDDAEEIAALAEEKREVVNDLLFELGEKRGAGCKAIYFRREKYAGWRCRCRRVEDWAAKKDEFYMDYCAKCRLSENKKEMMAMVNAIKQEDRDDGY